MADVDISKLATTKQLQDQKKELLKQINIEFGFLEDKINKVDKKVDGLDSKFNAMQGDIAEVLLQLRKLNDETMVGAYRQIHHTDRIEKLEVKVFGVAQTN